nr:hypothetical protein [Candidatus Sigynarchaeum springense]
MLPDGEGGAIIVWDDGRGLDKDIYMQRVNVEGESLWTKNGSVLCEFTENQMRPAICSDGAGGIIAAWRDERNSINSGIYAQHVWKNGSIHWNNQGVTVVPVSHNHVLPRICPDGDGGAYIAWLHPMFGQFTIRLQRVLKNGTLAWPGINGTAICTIVGPFGDPSILVDDNGDALISWGVSNMIFIQKVTSSGTPEWDIDGRLLCFMPEGYRFSPVSCLDGSNGAFIAWPDSRDGDLDIYIQRVNQAGTILLSPNGSLIAGGANDQDYPKLVSDGGTGAFLAWQDDKDGISRDDVYIQRVNANGGRMWGPDGVQLCSFPGDKEDIDVAPDGAGGCGVVWSAYYPDVEPDIYAQWLDANGQKQWEANGKRICGSPGEQSYPVIVNNAPKSFFYVWEDYRNSISSNSDVYAFGFYTAPTTPEDLAALIVGLSIGIPLAILGAVLVLYYFLGYRRGVGFKDFIKKGFSWFDRIHWPKPNTRD